MLQKPPSEVAQESGQRSAESEKAPDKEWRRHLLPVMVV
jgi:hypothetical protein